jgi:hypothetical protein
MSRNFKRVSYPWLRTTVSGLIAEARVRAQIIPFGFREAKIWQVLGDFLPVLSIPLSVSLL